MDLTTWARYKAYFGLANDATLSVAQPLIARASDHVIRFLGRDFGRTTHTAERLNGSDSQRLMLPDWPIISVSSVQIGSTVLSYSADAVALGYQYDDKMLYCFGTKFVRGLRNIVVSWTAGYAYSQTSFIPGTSPYTITPTASPEGSSFAAVDRGVTFAATGQSLTLVGSGPTTGQYAFADGVYTFAAADKSLAVTMSYDYVPGAVEQATMELVGLKVKQRDNLGISSKTLAGESIAYESKDMTPSIENLLWSYRKVAPA